MEPVSLLPVAPEGVEAFHSAVPSIAFGGKNIELPTSPELGNKGRCRTAEAPTAVAAGGGGANSTILMERCSPCAREPHSDGASGGDDCDCGGGWEGASLKDLITSSGVEILKVMRSLQ